SHFLEHLLFKGTRRRSALDIAAAIDAVGGEMNAFTAKEYTCFYARVLDNALPVAVDVVSDMVTSSLIRTADVDNERAVVLEEIAMHDDDPGDVVHDELAASVWGATPLGRPILGTDESIQAMSRAAVAGYYRRRYLPSSIVVAAAGNVDHAQLVRLVRAAIAGTPLAEGESVPAAPRRGGRTPAFRPGAAVVRRPIEQANLLLATEALARTDERRFALGVLNTALGGGMSSRLFQEIREKRGLAYSVYSFTAQYADTGLFGVSVGCQPERSGEVLSLAREQLADVVAHGLAEDELARGKAQMRGGVVLGMEDTGSRMTR